MSFEAETRKWVSVLDEVGLVGAGGVDRGSGRGLRAAAGHGIDTAEHCAEDTHRQLQRRRMLAQCSVWVGGS